MEGIEWRSMDGKGARINMEFDCDSVLAGAVSGGVVRERSSNGGEYCGGGQVFEDIVRGSLFAELEMEGLT